MFVRWTEVLLGEGGERAELSHHALGSYHVGLIQSLLPVVQLLLQEALLLTEQVLEVTSHTAGYGITTTN